MITAETCLVLGGKRRKLLEELAELAPKLPTKGDRSGFVAQMRYLEVQLDLIDELLSSGVENLGELIAESNVCCADVPENMYIEQAKAAIKEGQSLNDFVLHAHYAYRPQARKAYLSSIVTIGNL